ncbi:MAG TPA: acetyl-CoA carboxylase carboxyltransferase subunit alpha [Gaiellales bacterium]|jgi:acetyl-CoA carboxylase carboxyl transferase alpha subunit|nr:acetyl-CoA carboxylase carboxyltransferase subunit alpha [Gaiellales bacterium]
MSTTERERFGFFRRRGGERDAWHAVQLARHQDRPYTLDYLERICDDFIELHGDRAEGDDPAVVAGVGSFRGQSVAFVGHQKGRDLKQRTYRNFGMPSPEGYRKAMRVFSLAGRLGFPIVTLIDTPGAAPGVGAEQRGQSGAIARAQLTLMRVPVPVISCVIGEGSSGGALAIGVADRVLMQQNAVYTVISPEGCAAILWKDAGEAKRAAAALRPTAEACLALGVVDLIVSEPSGGAHRDHARAAELLGDAIQLELEVIAAVPPAQRRAGRRAKFRSMGAFQE